MNIEEKKTWIASLKVGSEVALVRDAWVNDDIKCKSIYTHKANIEKITPTGMLSIRIDGVPVIVNGPNARWGFDVGKIRGHMHDIGKEVAPVTPELEEHTRLWREHVVAKQQLADRVNAARSAIDRCMWRKMSLESLEAIAAIIEKDGKES